LFWLLNDLACGRLRDTAMGRWQALIDELIANLAAETPSEGLRINIDHKIREAETRASNLAAPATRAEKSAQRKQEFQAALRLTLGALRVRDPSNKVWVEALLLLGKPQLL
jgi:hypothetical protein